MVFDDQILANLSEEQAASSRTCGRCPLKPLIDSKAFSGSGRVCGRTVWYSFDSPPSLYYGPGVKSIDLSPIVSQPSRLFHKYSLSRIPSRDAAMRGHEAMQKVSQLLRKQ